MKLALIPPIAYLDVYSTNYHLILAHLYLSSADYRAFYQKRREKGEFCILDNGCAEGHLIDSKDLYLLALELRPNVLVCPDVLYDADATMTVTNYFLDTYGRLLLAKKIKLMAVPQGKTKEDWYRAYIWFNADPGISWLGISKYVAGAFPDRLSALNLIKGTRKKCHLLGMADDVDIIEKEKKFKFVQSTDTAVPIKLGLQDLRLFRYNERKKMSDEEYFNKSSLSFEQRECVEENVKDYKLRCK